MKGKRGMPRRERDMINVAAQLPGRERQGCGPVGVCAEA